MLRIDLRQKRIIILLQRRLRWVGQELVPGADEDTTGRPRSVVGRVPGEMRRPSQTP
jgi:hypothetical protein